MQVKPPIFLGADHRGYRAKERQKQRLLENGYKIIDLGAKVLDPYDDYTDYASEVAQKVSEGKGVGILFCASGEGMVMAANRYPKVRASLVWNTKVAKETREDNDANVLVLPAEMLREEEIDQIVDTWLLTPFSQKEKHKRRIQKLANLGKEVENGKKKEKKARLYN